MNAADERQLLEDIATIKAQMLTSEKCEEHRRAISSALTTVRIGLAVVYAVPPIVAAIYCTFKMLKML